MRKMIGFYKIENQEDHWDHRIVNTIFQEWIGSGCQKSEMFTKEYKGCDVPAHDKHCNGSPDNGRTE